MKLFSRIVGNRSDHLIVLHGLYGSGDNWLSIARKLSNTFTVHLPDMRNHGKSPHHYSHTYHDMVNDVIEYANTQQLETFYLAGHSMGGKTAMFLAALHPDRVKKLIVLDISPRNYHYLNDASQHTLFHMNLISFLINSGLESAKSLSEADAILAQGIEDQRLRRFMLKNVFKSGNTLRWRLNLDALLNNLNNILSGLNPDDFIDKKISLPTLFLRGTLSDYLPENDRKLIDFIFDNAAIVDIEGAGHWLHAENPNAVIRNIALFLLK